MTSEIFQTVLSRLACRLARQRRNILLLMDNAICHPKDMSDKLSHKKMVFLPKNTTSRLQPLDACIIKNCKCHYRKLLIKYVIANIDSDSSTTTSDIAQNINLLKAIEWVKQACDQVGLPLLLIALLLVVLFLQMVMKLKILLVNLMST